MAGGKWARSASGPYHLSPSSFVLKAFVLCLLSSVLKRDERTKDRGQKTKDGTGREDKGQRTKDKGCRTLDIGLLEVVKRRWRGGAAARFFRDFALVPS